MFLSHFLLHSDSTEKPVLFLWGLQTVSEVRSFVQMDKRHGFCGIARVCCSSVHESAVKSTKSLAFCRSYSLYALVLFIKRASGPHGSPAELFASLAFLNLVSIFRSQLFSESWLASGLFSDPCGPLHGKLHTTEQLMSLCPSTVVTEGFCLLPQSGLELQQMFLLHITVLLM